MLYEKFSRHLREKYPTRFHVADQLVDQLKETRHVRTGSKSAHELHTSNMLKAQREICFPLITRLNGITCEESKPITDSTETDPYLNECFRVAERIKNNRWSNRDRQICYENVILAQKLERIKKKAIDKDYRNHCRLLTSIISGESSYHSSALVENGSETLTSEHDDDQATAADMDASIEDDPSRSTVRKQRQNPWKRSPRENNRVYQRLNQIDMTIVKDTMPLSTPHISKHFSVCILPHFHVEKVNPLNRQSNDRDCAFKKEILYPI